MQVSRWLFHSIHGYVLVRIDDSKCDNFAWRLRATSCCEVLHGSIGVLTSLSCIDIGRPTEYEKCPSMMYSVHQRFLHRATTSAPGCSSDSCVCSPSYCAIRIACPSYGRQRRQQVYNKRGNRFSRKCTRTLFGQWNRNKARPDPALQLPVSCPSTRTHGPGISDIACTKNSAPGGLSLFVRHKKAVPKVRTRRYCIYQSW